MAVTAAGAAPAGWRFGLTLRAAFQKALPARPPLSGPEGLALGSASCVFAPEDTPIPPAAGWGAGQMRSWRDLTSAVLSEGAGPTVPYHAWGIPPERHPTRRGPPDQARDGEGQEGSGEQGRFPGISQFLCGWGRRALSARGKGARHPPPFGGVAAFKCRWRQRDGPRCISEKLTPDSSG